MTWLMRDPLAALEAALDDQEASLLSGRFDRLAEIEALMQNALSALNLNRLNPTHLRVLQKIKARALHQGNLLQAALRGVQDARTMRHNRQGFNSYDSLGRPDQVNTQRPRFEHRS